MSERSLLTIVLPARGQRLNIPDSLRRGLGALLVRFDMRDVVVRREIGEWSISAMRRRRTGGSSDR